MTIHSNSTSISLTRRQSLHGVSWEMVFHVKQLAVCLRLVEAVSGKVKQISLRFCSAYLFVRLIRLKMLPDFFLFIRRAVTLLANHSTFAEPSRIPGRGQIQGDRLPVNSGASFLPGLLFVMTVYDPGMEFP